MQLVVQPDHLPHAPTANRIQLQLLRHESVPVSRVLIQTDQFTARWVDINHLAHRSAAGDASESGLVRRRVTEKVPS